MADSPRKWWAPYSEDASDVPVAGSANGYGGEVGNGLLDVVGCARSLTSVCGSAPRNAAFPRTIAVSLGTLTDDLDRSMVICAE
jgi:hypothetical protein